MLAKVEARLLAGQWYGIEHVIGYSFKFGRTQLISEMPLAINPTGCARSEPSLRTYVRKRPGAMSSTEVASRAQVMPQASSLSSLEASTNNNNAWTLQSRTHQLRRLRIEWKTNIVLGRSRIQGLGLYAARDLEKHSFIIEYLGETIRNEVGNKRERLYQAQNRGIYMFRASDDCIVDATMCGGLARYINHSCEPNCMAEVVHFDGLPHIIIIANRRVEKGEELTYDYKFDFEEDRPNDRIPCLCGAPACRKWMN
ncbi:hypothetical protein Ciccas_003957 [Cichlidogyrus casuarinus]|uniref:Uncharacterized protein n=1 Tax=Cichlidogyrus casuarinus TaxID=1844966 RepID=A0ABD2QCW0_9PLAT